MSNSVRFLLNGLTEVAAEAPPDLSVLQWLRTHRRLTGTKEGCAEGDCGACTIVLADAHESALNWRAANACILMMGQVHGKLLVTVEGLADGALLHPVQAAMVERHASQCGFCTPGFVMSLFAAYRQGEAPETEAIHDALAGNLCRCTGYRPIVDAARDALPSGGIDRFTPMEPAIVASLHAINNAGALDCVTKHGRFTVPRTRADLARELAANPEARIISGGTDLALDITKRHQRLPHLISLVSVPELRRIEVSDIEIIAGAAATYAELLPHLAMLDPSFEVLLRRLGSRQIRSLGTIGGNLANASPIGDTPPALLALGAFVRLESAAGSRELGLDDFFTGYRRTALQPGEFIESVRIPKPAHGALFRVDKISRRFDQDISAVCGAIAFSLRDGLIHAPRIAVGGMAATPLRARHAEVALVETQSFERAADALAQDFQPLSDFRASADYRLQTAQNLFERWRLIAAEARQ